MDQSGQYRLKWTVWTKLDRIELRGPYALNWTDFFFFFFDVQIGLNRPNWKEWTNLDRIELSGPYR